MFYSSFMTSISFSKFFKDFHTTQLIKTWLCSYNLLKDFFTILMHTSIGSVAEWSKALDLGSSLSGGVGSNPTAVICFLHLFYCFPSRT